MRALSGGRTPTERCAADAIVRPDRIRVWPWTATTLAEPGRRRTAPAGLGGCGVCQQRIRGHPTPMEIEMPRGESRDPQVLIEEVDQQISQLRARKQLLVAREKQKRQRQDEKRARLAGEALRRACGSWDAPELRDWIEHFLVSDQERAAFGFGPLDKVEKERRLASIRKHEARWDQSRSGAAGGQPKQSDAAGGDARSGSSAGVTPPAGGGVDPGDDTRVDWIL